MLTQNKIIIDFHGSYRSSKLFSRMLWQQLFDIYREKGGQLTNLDNFLCDLDYFEEQFEKGWKNPLCWCTSLDNNYTELVEVEFAKYATVRDLQVILTYTGKTMELEILDEGN